MNVSRYLMASVAAGVWIIFYGFVANTVVLAEFWATQAAPGLMRPEGEEVMWAIMASCMLQGLALGYIFTKGYNNTGLFEGVRFGFLIAWFVASVYLLFYGLQPWSGISTVVSATTDGIMYIGAGVILALIYKP